MRRGDPRLAPLASGELSPRDATELALLKRRIEALAGLRCEGYKEKCLRRRIAVRMRAREVHRYADYDALLTEDAAELRTLIDALTINVSKFFRNPEVWRRIGGEVIPALAALDAPRIAIWSAGAAAGEEIYSVAMLLLEHAEREGLDLRRFELCGTDIDERALEEARRAEYGAFAFADTPLAMRERWFEGPDRNRLRAEVRALVRFQRHDLMTEVYPAGRHFILCRNVAIYFERGVQQRMFRRFHEALSPGGWLLLGKVEALFGEELRAFQVVAGRERLFRKP